MVRRPRTFPNALSDASGWVRSAVPTLRAHSNEARTSLNMSHVDATPSQIRLRTRCRHTTMKQDMPLRDPFATEVDSTLQAAGRPPQRSSRPGQAPLRNVDESFHTQPSRPAPSLGAPRLVAAEATARDRAMASPSCDVSAPSLGLSLGVPRGRAKANVGQADDSAVVAGPLKQADDAVRNTDSDALLSRLSALKMGYLPSEPFTQEFSASSPSSSGHPTARSSFPQLHQPGASTRRSPLINIGTYLRCSTIDAEVESFLQHGDGKKQIISIGAGSDSRYWRIMANVNLSERLHHYVEIDFAENANQKLSRILRSSVLRASLDADTNVQGVPLTELPQPHVESRTDSKRFDVIRSSKYSLLAADVRNLYADIPPSERIDLEQLLGSASTGLDQTLPTLILFECVLAYIAPDKADWLIKTLGQRFTDIQALSYDIALAGDASDSAPTRSGLGRADDIDTAGKADIFTSAKTASQSPAPPSRFGKVMVQNLEYTIRLSIIRSSAIGIGEHRSETIPGIWTWSGKTCHGFHPKLDRGRNIIVGDADSLTHSDFAREDRIVPRTRLRRIATMTILSHRRVLKHRRVVSHPGPAIEHVGQHNVRLAEPSFLHLL
ncbi:leucine carboxyl methyltransferase [Pseudozyma hubeiensis SY62]|uniref:Leucine carboxyl methyltransferase 1 n=1 Tax=Pseudozyma hubeiensis (strain SY62) TaxID=1305764 RepID=R9P3L4_PSEHS|nr:leucine carboxyl methyltransferase [Pseudozyma hubeiensis SY62]GAC95874.1 leucine carboxyl methyltransferase [Pseudozyma hubeiensis SY62]